MTASAWWIGVESMTAAALTAAAAHPRPIFCGRLSLERSVQALLADAGKRVEAHEVALHTAIGQGYLLDLMRQRMPIEHITLALPAISTGQGVPSESSITPLDTVMTEAREVIESLIVVTRGAEAVLAPGVGVGMTVLCPAATGSRTPLARGLLAFVGEFVSAESARWQARGLSLALVSERSMDQ